MKRKIVISALIIASFVLAAVSVIYIIRTARDLRRLDPLEIESMSREDIIQMIYSRQSRSQPFIFIIPLFGFFGIAVGAMVYYVMSGDIEKKDEIIKGSSSVILKLLSPDERKVIKKLIESDGRIQQQEVTYMEGFTKVKAHRVVESLLAKGMVQKDRLGKTKLIRLNKDASYLLK